QRPARRADGCGNSRRRYVQPAARGYAGVGSESEIIEIRGQSSGISFPDLCSLTSTTMKDSDVIILEEPRLSLGDQFYLPQVLAGLGTTMKHMLQVLGGKDRVIQYPEE